MRFLQLWGHTVQLDDAFASALWIALNNSTGTPNPPSTFPTKPTPTPATSATAPTTLAGHTLGAPTSPSPGPGYQWRGAMSPGGWVVEGWVFGGYAPGAGLNDISAETPAQYAIRTASQTGFNIAELGAFLQQAASIPLATNADKVTYYMAKGQLTGVDSAGRKIEFTPFVWTGPIQASSLTNDEKLAILNSGLSAPQLNTIVGGSNLEFVQAMGWADAHRGQSDGSGVRPEIQAAINAARA